MRFSSGGARVAASVFFTLSILVACVGDSVTPGPDASTDAQGTPDTSAADTGAPEAGSDASSDATGTETGPTEAGVCSNAQLNNTINLPTSGANFFNQQSMPIQAGTYALTSAYYQCSNCTVVQAVATGGLIITVNGPTVTIERRMELQSQAVTQTVFDRWSGTFSQLNQDLTITRECPTTSSATDWFANFPPVDGGPARLDLYFPNELQVKDSSSSATYGPTFVFTHQ